MGLLRPGARVSSSRSKQLTDLDQMLKERQILLCQMLEADLNWMLEADLEVCDVILADELERGLHSSNGWNLSVELDKAHALTDRITNERTGEARRLSQHNHGDFQCPGRPGHAAPPGHSPTSKVSSGNLASGSSHLEARVRSAGLQC
jgi:hypothetical protein